MNDNVIFLICYIPTPVILLIAGLVMWRAPAQKPGTSPRYSGGGS